MKAEELDALKAELRAKYPNSKLKGLKFADVPGRGDVIVVLRSLTQPERVLYIPKIKRNEDAAANKQLTLQVTVHPSREALEAFLEVLPVACEKIASEAIDLGGMEAEDLGNF